MAKSKRKLSDINNEYKKQNESYRQAMEVSNRSAEFWYNSYKSLINRHCKLQDNIFEKTQASFATGYILGSAVFILLELLGRWING